MNALEKAQIYQKYLAEEGYTPKIDSDGDVIFKAEGKTYFFSIDSKDEPFFRLVFPNFWNIESNDELVKVIIAANHATMLTKVAKVYVNSDGKNTSASVEMLLPNPNDFKLVFRRALTLAQAGVSNFVDKMKEIS